MRAWTIAAAVVVSSVLSGCDKIDALTKEQGAQGDRIAKLEAELAALKAKRAEVDSSFNGCVLQHMAGVSTDMAAEAVKESCLHKVEAPLSPASLALLRGQAWFVQDPQSGPELVIDLSNASDYTITELVLSVSDKNGGYEEYTKRWFASGNVFGTIKDKTVYMMMKPGKSRIVQPISQSTKDPKVFFDTHAWNVVSAKGFKN